MQARVDVELECPLMLLPKNWPNGTYLIAAANGRMRDDKTGV
jgi:hypothetical protein